MLCLGHSRNIARAISKTLHACVIVSRTASFRNTHTFASVPRIAGELNFSRNVQAKLQRTTLGVQWFRTRKLGGICIFQTRNYAPKATTIDMSLNSPAIQNYLETLLEEYNQSSKEMVAMEDTREENLGRLSRTIMRLKPVVEMYKAYCEKQESIKESEELIQSMPVGTAASTDDVELAKMAKLEIQDMKEARDELEAQILVMLVPREKADHNDIILEVSSGVGGQEAMLFTGEIFDMYTNYAAYKGWGCQVIAYDEAEVGVRKASAAISGEDVYKYLKYEGGVHRVQRCPKTEKSGRIHTSTMTVAILPQPTEIDIQLSPKDLKITAVRASGPGGQHVNMTNSAVRIVHIPTGIATECQTGRSQIKNKQVAINMLRSKLYQMELEARTKDLQSRRKLQVGTKGRSEKIRTYQFNQDRITDHRLGENMFNVEQFLLGGEALDDMVQLLQEESAKEALMDIIDQFELKTSKAKSKS